MYPRKGEYLVCITFNRNFIPKIEYKGRIMLSNVMYYVERGIDKFRRREALEEIFIRFEELTTKAGGGKINYINDYEIVLELPKDSGLFPFA